MKEAFTNPKEPDRISLNLVKRNINLLAPDYFNKDSAISQREVADRLSHVDPKVKKTLQKISNYLKKQRIDTMAFFEFCDEDGDGLLTDEEFIKGVMHWKIVGMKEEHPREVYHAIDVNSNESLSIGEIYMYIEGAQPTIAERGKVIERELTEDINDQIVALFNEFKEEGKKVTKESVKRILSAYSVPTNVITKTLQSVRTDTEGKISKENFKKFMADFLKEKILEVENDINELRAMFYEADLDKSGFLDMDELYNFFNVRLEAHITRDELKNLVKAVDLDYNGSLDIDEFIDLMTKKPSDQGGSGSAQATYMRIRKSRKFDMTEFVKFLKKFPDHFQESFSARLYTNKRCLPSSAFTSFIIPHDEASIKKTKKIVTEPTIKTTETIIAAQITFDQAKGVPFPEEDKISTDSILKRVVRVTLFDFDSNKFITGSSFVLAKWNSKTKDQWKFNKESETGTNPLIFRTDDFQCKERNIHLIFEFVVYCKMNQDTCKELNCGWAQLKISDLDKKSGKFNLDINGGSPEMRTEVSFLEKNKKKKTNSKFSLSFRGLKDFSEKTQLHFKMLPST